MSDDFVERLAEQAHRSWSGWARYMIDHWSPESVARWERQIATPYADLTEQEKQSDRVEARAYLHVIESLTPPDDLDRQVEAYNGLLTHSVAGPVVEFLHTVNAARRVWKASAGVKVGGDG